MSLFLYTKMFVFHIICCRFSLIQVINSRCTKVASLIICSSNTQLYVSISNMIYWMQSSGRIFCVNLYYFVTNLFTEYIWYFFLSFKKSKKIEVQTVYVHCNKMEWCNQRAKKYTVVYYARLSFPNRR